MSLVAERRPARKPVAWVARRSGPASIVALGLLMTVASVLIYRKGLGTIFFYDEWSWLLDRQPWRRDIFLEPHNGHLSLFPVAVFKLLFETVGATDYWVYRVVLIGFHLGCVSLLFVYARRRVGDALALAAAAALLFLGSAWHDLLVPFQVSFLASVAAGLGMWLALERRDLPGDAVATVLLAVAFSSSSIGIPLAVAAFVELVWWRVGWRRLWVAAAPTALYLLWYLDHRDSPQGAVAAVGPLGAILRSNVPALPSYMAEAAAGAFGGLVGLSIDWGRPLALVGAFFLVRRLLGAGPVSPRLAALLACAVAYWGLVGVLRAQINAPTESRYLYFGVVLIVLVALELGWGLRLARRSLAALALLLAAASLANFRLLRDGSLHLQGWSGTIAAELAALELAGPSTDPEFTPDAMRAPPVKAGLYFKVIRDIGSPADSPDEVLRRGEPDRQAADGTLVAALRIAPEPVRALPARGAPPPVDAAQGGGVRFRGPCVVFRAAGAAQLDVTLPAAGVVVQNTGAAPAEFRLRTFADSFPQPAHGTIPPGSVQRLRIPARPLPRPWHLRLSVPDRVQVCRAASEA